MSPIPQTSFLVWTFFDVPYSKMALEMVLIAILSRENTASKLEGVPTSPDIWLQRDFMKLTVKLTNRQHCGPTR